MSDIFGEAEKYNELATKFNILCNNGDIAGFNALIGTVDLLELFRYNKEAIEFVAHLAIKSRNWELIRWLTKFPNFHDSIELGIKEAIYDREVVDFLINLGIYPNIKVLMDAIPNSENFSRLNPQIALEIASNSGSEEVLINLLENHPNLNLTRNIIQNLIDLQNLQIIRGIWPSIFKNLDKSLILRIFKTRNNDIIEMLFVPGLVLPSEALTEAIEQENLVLVDALLRRPEFLQIDKTPFLMIGDNLEIINRLLQERRIMLESEFVASVIQDAIDMDGPENVVALANLLLSYRPNVDQTFLREAKKQLPRLQVPGNTRRHQLENEFELPAKK